MCPTRQLVRGARALLWKRDIGLWHQHLWPLKSGPQRMTRRLVAVGDRVYVTLGIDSPLTALDAAMGETIRTYEQTKATEEILCDGGVLFLSVAGEGQPLRSDPRRVFETVAEIKTAVTDPLWSEAPRTLIAVDPESGETLWQKPTNVASMSLAVDNQRVLFHDGQRIQCLDRSNGNTIWSSESLPVRESMRSSSGVTRVLHDDVVLYSGMVAIEKYTQRSSTMFALSLADGRAPVYRLGKRESAAVGPGSDGHGSASIVGHVTGSRPHGQERHVFRPLLRHRCALRFHSGVYAGSTVTVARPGERQKAGRSSQIIAAHCLTRPPSINDDPVRFRLRRTPPCGSNSDLPPVLASQSS